MNNIKNLSDFVSKSATKPAIQKVLVEPARIVATDAFRMIERKTATGVASALLVQMPPRLKTFEHIQHGEAGTILDYRGASYKAQDADASEYPKFDEIFPKDEPVATVRVNAKYLRDMATAFEEVGAVEIAIYGSEKAVLFTGQDTRGLLMPMNK